MKSYTTWTESLKEWKENTGTDVYFFFGEYSNLMGTSHCKGIVATINDETRAGSSQFYIGEIIDYNDNFLLWQNDIHYSILNRKTGVFITMNLEEDESWIDDEENPINQMWKVVQ